MADKERGVAEEEARRKDGSQAYRVTAAGGGERVPFIPHEPRALPSRRDQKLLHLPTLSPI